MQHYDIYDINKWICLFSNSILNKIRYSFIIVIHYLWYIINFENGVSFNYLKDTFPIKLKEIVILRNMT
jgi:hypothetical protein